MVLKELVRLLDPLQNMTPSEILAACVWVETTCIWKGAVFVPTPLRMPA